MDTDITINESDKVGFTNKVNSTDKVGRTDRVGITDRVGFTDDVNGKTNRVWFTDSIGHNQSTLTNDNSIGDSDSIGNVGNMANTRSVNQMPEWKHRSVPNAPLVLPHAFPRFLHQIWWQGVDKIPNHYESLRASWLEHHPRWLYRYSFPENIFETVTNDI